MLDPSLLRGLEFFLVGSHGHLRVGHSQHLVIVQLVVSSIAEWIIVIYFASFEESIVYGSLRTLAIDRRDYSIMIDC